MKLKEIYKKDNHNKLELPLFKRCEELQKMNEEQQEEKRGLTKEEIFQRDSKGRFIHNAQERQQALTKEAQL